MKKEKHNAPAGSQDQITPARSCTKIFNDRADLAINGALPAFDELIHVGKPNVGNRLAFLTYANDILERQWLTNNGPLVQELENRIADYHKVEHCVCMSNGTIALEIAIRAFDLQGEVILPSFTFIATAHALHWQGIKPVFADIDPRTHNIDPESVSALLSKRTTGILGVHLWGQCANVEQLQEIADNNSLKLIFDAAHAFGCSHGNKMVGNFGDAEVLSFHATKFFNTFEGGAVLTNSTEMAEKMRLMRNFGFNGRDSVIHPGTNGKMTEICAAMGVTNLDSIEKIIQTNETNFNLYKNEISHLPHIKMHEVSNNATHNYQYIVIEVSDDCPVTRDYIIQALHAENVIARRYFYPGCHKMAPYDRLFPESDIQLPVTQSIANRVIVLPTGTSVNESKIRTISSIIRVLVS